MIPRRILDKVLVPENGGFQPPCWLWTCAKQNLGYGMTWFDGKLIYAHRFFYEQIVGVIPNKKQLDHLCRVTNCVNPAHLEAVSHRTNILRGKHGALKTHCANGHPWIPENIYRCKSKHAHYGFRNECLICKRIREAKPRKRTYLRD